MTVWPGMLPGRAGGNVRNGGLVESGNRRIGGPGNRENGGGAESRRKKHGEPGRVPSHGRHGGCGWGYLRGRMATMRVPPEKHGYVFERFTKLDTFSQGNGLGLYLCRLIVTHLHGEIYIDSGYTGGTRIVAILPRR